MPNIFHQSVEDILRAATPEQKLLWNYIFLRWGERVSISQLVYIGTVALSGEFLTYSANKLYVAYEMDLDGQISPQQGPGYLQLFDPANVWNQTMGKNMLVWDTTAALIRYYSCNVSKRNFIFSRISQGVIMGNIKFIGYRIAI